MINRLDLDFTKYCKPLEKIIFNIEKIVETLPSYQNIRDLLITIIKHIEFNKLKHENIRKELTSFSYIPEDTAITLRTYKTRLHILKNKFSYNDVYKNIAEIVYSSISLNSISFTRNKYYYFNDDEFIFSDVNNILLTVCNKYATHTLNIFKTIKNVINTILYPISTVILINALKDFPTYHVYISDLNLTTIVKDILDKHTIFMKTATDDYDDDNHIVHSANNKFYDYYLKYIYNQTEYKKILTTDDNKRDEMIRILSLETSATHIYSHLMKLINKDFEVSNHIDKTMLLNDVPNNIVETIENNIVEIIDDSVKDIDDNVIINDVNDVNDVKDGEDKINRTKFFYMQLMNNINDDEL
jgi:hypothetical protein